MFLAVLFILLHIYPLKCDYDDALEGKSITVTGYVDSIRYKNDTYQVLISKVKNQDHNYSKKVYLYLKSNESLPRIGQKISAHGTVKYYEAARNPGNFSMRDYYQIRGVLFYLKDAAITKKSKQYSIIKDTLYHLRLQLENSLDASLPQKYADQLKAILLGNKDEIDSDIKDLYQKSGISHAFCISGLHISMIGVFLYEALKKCKLKRKIAALFTILFLFCYGIMCNNAQAMVRAIIMFSIKAIGDVSGRAYDSLTALSIAGIMSLLVNPLYIYDSGFLLSYMAVIGAGAIQPALASIATFLSKYKLYKALIMSISVSIMTIPVTLWFFYQYPTYSALLNLIIIPLLSVVVAVGFIGMVLGCVNSSVSTLICYPLRLILEIYEVACEKTINLPGSTAIVGRPAIGKVIIYYLLLVFFIIVALKKYKKTSVIIMIAAISMLFYRQDDGFKLTAIDVGQGNCIFIKCDGEAFLFDAGSSDVKRAYKYRISPYLKYEGVEEIKAVFLSHLDEDHINALEESIDEDDGILIKQVLLSGNSLASTKGQELYKKLIERGIRVSAIGAGDSISLRKLKLHCLYPTLKERGEENECSMVMRADYGKLSVLLPGDIEGKGLSALEKCKLGKCDCYIVAHHGSNNSSSEKMLAEIMPTVAIVSCGVNNSYGHPHKETIERLNAVGSQTYITAKNGAITLLCDGESLNIRKFL